jgi:hypothetical protein
MQPVRVIIAIAAATVVLGAARWSQRQPSSPPRVTDSVRAAHARREVVRLRAHFDSVDAELRARDVSRLTPGQRAARLELIAWLRDYRNAGRFPANDEPGAAPVPIFRDAHGTLCAMAYLVDRSGRGDVVDRVASTRNTAYVRELVDDTALVAWLDANGLTAAEAGRIQPQYGGPTPPSAGKIDDRVSAGYALTSLALGGASLGTGGVNLVAPTRTGGLLGLAAGTAALVAGATQLDQSGGTYKVAVANTAVGAAALGMGLRALLASRAPLRSARTTSADRSVLRGAMVAPAVLPSGRPGGDGRLGMLVHATF